MRGRKIFDHDFHKSDGMGAFEMNADSFLALSALDQDALLAFLNDL